MKYIINFLFCGILMSLMCLIIACAYKAGTKNAINATWRWGSSIQEDPNPDPDV